MERTSENQRLCDRRKCKAQFRALKARLMPGRYYPSGARQSDARNPITTGFFKPPKSDRPWRHVAGMACRCRGANYLVRVNANPVREADLDFGLEDVGLVLRQMEGSGTQLNLVFLDACRNNPFGGRGLRATDTGLAQMRAPEGTLISFDSPFTGALARTIRKPGLAIFDAINEVGLAVKVATGGSQQPWFSTSPIGGSFYFTPAANGASSARVPSTSAPAAVTATPLVPKRPQATVTRAETCVRLCV